MSLAAVLEAPQTDEVLAARARHGERGAFSTLFLRHQARIYQLAIRISRNCSDAEELTQDTCRRALRGIAIGGALYAATPRVDWASLLRRSFDVDVMQCPKCQGRLRMLAVITEREPVHRILAHLGVPLLPHDTPW